MGHSFFSSIRKLQCDALEDALKDVPTWMLKKLTKTAGIFFNYREVCSNFRVSGLPIPSLDVALSFFGKCSELVFINTEADGNIYILADSYLKEDKTINILYFVFLQIQLLLHFLDIATNEFEETSVGTAFESYTFLNLYTGPPGIKQLFSISIPLRRVLFASDIL